MVAGDELSPSYGMPRIFTYYADQDSLDDIISTPAYFGYGVNDSFFTHFPTISTQVSHASWIVVRTDTPSGTPPVGTGLWGVLVVISIQNELVVVGPWSPYTPVP